MLGLWLSGGPALAQTNAIQPNQEFEKRMRGAQVVGALTSELFGESVSLYNGSTEFTATDIDLPGNNALPVRLGRRFKIEVRRDSDNLGGFGTWDIDVSYMYGTFDSIYKWNTGRGGETARCSAVFVPQTVSPLSVTDIWAGNHVSLPGRGSQEVLSIAHANHAGVPRPTDGPAYPWGTRDGMRFSCKPNTANGYPGEGFIGVDTDGTRYVFDVGVERAGGRVEDSFGIGRDRTKVFLLASRVEDRHGNWVNYTYSNGLLTAITSSDGRTITLTYSGNRISSAPRTAGRGPMVTTQRTWEAGCAEPPA